MSIFSWLVVVAVVVDTVAVVAAAVASLQIVHIQSLLEIRTPL